MSGKGAHINVLGERIRRYYEHLMADAHTFVDELRKDFEGPTPDARQQPTSRGPSSPGSSSPGPSSQSGKRAH